MTELESQIKHTQHEHELTRLRKPETDMVSPTVSEPPTTTTTGSKEVTPVLPTTSQTIHGRHFQCSRYQFECHSSRECIAIYNACDGIPQCADGSDEAPELGCPAQVSTVAPAPKVDMVPEPPVNPQPGPASSSSHQGYPAPANSGPSPGASPDMMPVLSKQFKNNQWPPQMYEIQHMSNPVNNYLHAGSVQSVSMSGQAEPQAQADFQQSPPQLVSQAKQYGREGEALLYRPSAALQWPAQDQMMPYQPGNSGGSQIFSHKGSGLMAGPDSMAGQFEPMQTDYARYNNYYENGPYHKPLQASNNWQPLHKPHDMIGMEENMNVGVPNLPQNNMPGQDYYYEENFRTRLQPQLVPQRLNPPNNMLLPPEPAKVKPIHKGEAEVENQEVLADTENKAATSNTSVKKATAHHTSTNNSTEKPKEAHHHVEHHHNSHRKVETLSAELSLAENAFDSDVEGQNVNPRGAILSLTMGLCVTGIMLVLVGCRMRMVRRRMRRGSKSPYAHDADFLVNGMYL